MAKRKNDKESVNKYIDLVSSNGGRPRKIINEDGLEAIKKLSSIMCTDEEIASFLGISADTLNSKYNKTAFSECKKEGQSGGKVSLRRMQFKSAEAGNVSMQIWLGKQYLGQKEQQETTIANDSNISFLIKPASERPTEED